MDWGDASFCLVAALLVIASVMVSRNLHRLAVAVQKLAARPNS